jgi:hypothetical protein
MKIDSLACKLLREKINAALAPLGKELGVVILAKNATYNHAGTNATFKLEVAAIGESGQVETKGAAAYRELHQLFGLPADGLFKEIIYAGKPFKIVGLLPRSEKSPLLAQAPDGKQYRLSLKALVP